jgi:hypothetical protein
VEFRPGDADRVLSHMRAAAARGRGWVNLQPVPVREEDAATTTSLFSGPSPPKLPLCTWKIEERRGRVERTIGIQHGIGTRLVPRLREAGLTAPGDFKVLQDHRRRGLVVLVPEDAAPDTVLDWLLRVGEVLAVVETTGSWAAELYEG